MANSKYCYLSFGLPVGYEPSHANYTKAQRESTLPSHTHARTRTQPAREPKEMVTTSATSASSFFASAA
jgi:hypothetical protein